MRIEVCWPAWEEGMRIKKRRMDHGWAYGVTFFCFLFEISLKGTLTLEVEKRQLHRQKK